jgi:hypothetical protein
MQDFQTNGQYDETAAQMSRLLEDLLMMTFLLLVAVVELRQTIFAIAEEAKQNTHLGKI